MAADLERNGKCIIVGAGDFTCGEGGIKKQAEDFCIAADGGFLYCKLVGLLPDYFIGDMDSLPEAQGNDVFTREEDEAEGGESVGRREAAAQEESADTEVEHTEVVHRETVKKINASLAAWLTAHPDAYTLLPVVKDDTDTMAAIRLGYARGYRLFHIYGGLGGRLSHTLANIQSLAWLKERGASGVLFNGTELVTLLADEELCFPAGTYGDFSVFSYGERAEGVTIAGAKYALADDALIDAFPLGVSNAFTGRETLISVKKGRLLVVADFAEE